MENKFIRVEEVAKELDVSKPYAYKIIRQLNEELKNLRHIKSNMDTLLDDEGYNADLHHHNELNTSERDRHADSKDR